jgi:hypothetical protein
MNRYLLFTLALLLWISCNPRKTETATTTAPADSVAIDSVLATTPAPAMLAFAPIDGFTAAKGLQTPDSINYFLLNNPDELQKSFVSASSATPDFIINYVIGVACQATPRATTITLDKVATAESSIDVYLNIIRGDAGKSSTKPAQLFAIEKREGYPVMQFYVNGKKDKALVLVGNP